MKQLKTFNFPTFYEYYVLPEKEQLFAKVNNSFLKVNLIYDKQIPYFPIRTSKGNVEYISKYNLFKIPKIEVKDAIKITAEMSIEERNKAKRFNKNAYHREYYKQTKTNHKTNNQPK